jgi:hypothetical protein
MVANWYVGSYPLHPRQANRHDRGVGPSDSLGPPDARVQATITVKSALVMPADATVVRPEFFPYLPVHAGFLESKSNNSC